MNESRDLKEIDMLLKVKNVDLYNQWINYYQRTHKEMAPHAMRTYAFISSQNGEPVPLV